MSRIVIAEDEEFMREELEYLLSGAGYETVSLNHFSDTASEILANNPDLVLLDINLPGQTGFEVCRFIRRKSLVPVLVLTSRDNMKDELHALGLGADEYLPKPCHRDRLLARIANLLRRYKDKEHFLEVPGIRLDLNTYTIYTNQTSYVLLENQGKIMEQLLSPLGRIVSKEELFQTLWGTSEYVDENALQVNMTRLKKTLERLALNYRIVTVRGTGYFIEQKQEDPHAEETASLLL